MLHLEPFQELFQGSSIHSIFEQTLTATAVIHVWQNEFQADAVVAPSHGLRLHRDRAAGTLLGFSFLLKRHHDQRPWIPSLFRDQKQPSRADIPDTMLLRSRAIPEIRGQFRRGLPV